MEAEATEQFVRQLTASQRRLYAYIMSLTANVDAAEEVLQNTNVTLWRKADEFEAGTQFARWSFRVAYYEVLAYRKRCFQDRHVFDDGLLNQIAHDAMRLCR